MKSIIENKSKEEKKATKNNMCVCLVTDLCPTPCNPQTVPCQAPLPKVFSWQEYWSRLPFPSPGDLLNPRIEPASLVSPALAGRFLTTEPTGKPLSRLLWCSQRLSCLTLCDSMDCSLPSSSVHGISQTRSRLPFPSPGDFSDSDILNISPLSYTQFTNIFSYSVGSLARC